MQTIAKITPADYPDLLAAVDAGMTQRELARRYDCAPSLVARHVARAERARELSEPAGGSNPGLTADPHEGSMHEILEARIRDPKTSARDLASLLNARARLDAEETPAADRALRVQTARSEASYPRARGRPVPAAEVYARSPGVVLRPSSRR